MPATLPKTEPTSDKRKSPAAASVSDQPAALAPSGDVGLPTPAELPDADVVIYDGHCKFCTSQVKNLAHWDGKGRLAFLSLHDEEVAKCYPDLTYEQMMEEMVVVDRQGRRHHGAAAFRYLTTRLPRLYILAPLMHIPFSMPFWRWGYKQVAKRRYLMGKTADACDDGACKVHFK